MNNAQWLATFIAKKIAKRPSKNTLHIKFCLSHFFSAWFRKMCVCMLWNVHEVHSFSPRFLSLNTNFCPYIHCLYCYFTAIMPCQSVKLQCSCVLFPYFPLFLSFSRVCVSWGCRDSVCLVTRNIPALSHNYTNTLITEQDTLIHTFWKWVMGSSCSSFAGLLPVDSPFSVSTF